MQAMQSPLGMLFCHHDDTEQLSNLEKCHDNILAMTLFISLDSHLNRPDLLSQSLQW